MVAVAEENGLLFFLFRSLFIGTILRTLGYEMTLKFPIMTCPAAGVFTISCVRDVSINVKI